MKKRENIIFLFLDLLFQFQWDKSFFFLQLNNP